MHTLWLLQALAAPNGVIPVQGALTDGSGAPVEGVHSVTFQLWASSSATTALWEDDLNVAFSGGAFAAQLGADEILDLALLNDAPALHVSVGLTGGAPSERLAIGWSPLAVRAAFADHAAEAALLDGHPAGDFLFNPGAGLTLTGTTFAAVPYTAGDGLSLSGRAFSALPYSAGAGLSQNGRTFSATQYLAGAGLSLTGATFAAVPYTAADGLTLTGQAFAALPYAAGTGMTLTGRTFAPSQAWAEGIADARIAAASGVAGQTYNSTTQNTTFTGAIRLQTGAVGCTTAAEYGSLRWNGTAFQGCTSAGWQALGTGGSGGTKTIVSNTAGRKWSDDTFAISCKEYRYPTDTSRSYAGLTGDGVYTIDIDGSGPDTPLDVWCEMDLETGGWTLVGKFNLNVTGPAIGGTTWRVDTDVNLAYLTAVDSDTTFNAGHLSKARIATLVSSGEKKLMTHIKQHSTQNYKYCMNVYASGIDSNWSFVSGSSTSAGVGSCGRFGWGYANTCGVTSTTCASYDANYTMDAHWMHANGLNTGTIPGTVVTYCGDNSTSGISGGSAAIADRRGTCYLWAR